MEYQKPDILADEEQETIWVGGKPVVGFTESPTHYNGPRRYRRKKTKRNSNFTKKHPRTK